MKINPKLFPFSFFLSDKIKVDNLEEGAILYGGATKFDDGVYSNIQGNEYITVKESENEISIFVPSTMDIDKDVNNSEYVQYCINYLSRFYNVTNLKYYKTQGSWFSEDRNKIVYDNITIITLKKDNLTEVDINIFIELAKWIKEKMKQEGVSITINTALAIL